MTVHVPAVFIDDAAPRLGRRVQRDRGARGEGGLIGEHLEGLVQVAFNIGLVDVDEILPVLSEHRRPLAISGQRRPIGAALGVFAGVVVHPPHKSVAAVGRRLQGDGLANVIGRGLHDPGGAGLEAGIQIDVHPAGGGLRLDRRPGGLRGRLRREPCLRGQLRRNELLFAGPVRVVRRERAGREQARKHQKRQQQGEDPFFHERSLLFVWYGRTRKIQIIFHLCYSI